MKFSIITICKNAAGSIADTIESVIMQTYSDYEYIIVDGASEDGTVDTICSYSGLDIKIISEPDRGISDAFNKGIKISAGDILFFLNSGDCFVGCNVLEKAASDIKDHEADIYTYSVTSRMNLRFPESQKAGEVCWERAMIPHQGTFIRKEVFEEVGLFSENYKIRMDYDFFWRCRRAGMRFFCNPVVITYYDSNGISSKNKYCFEKEGLAVRLLYNDKTEACEEEVIDFLIGQNKAEAPDYLEKIRSQRKLIEKDHMIIVAMYRWLQAALGGCRLSRYFFQHGFRVVAIYGFGMLGKLLQQELLSEKIDVSYVIDQEADALDGNVISWEDEWRPVDCIVVTPFYIYAAIREQIKREKGEFKIISLEEVLADKG